MSTVTVYDLNCSVEESRKFATERFAADPLLESVLVVREKTATLYRQFSDGVGFKAIIFPLGRIQHSSEDEIAFLTKAGDR